MEKHREGYAFKTISFPVYYEFEKVKPESMIYKLEYTALIEDLDDYITFLSEYGWEYIGTHFDFSYFRKIEKTSVMMISSQIQHQS